jgi:hypothetical protein
VAFVRGPIIVATGLWATAEILKIARPRSVDAARGLWTLTAALVWLHAIAAFHQVYGWSQAVAIDATARQTASLTGLAWGGGLFVNYAFLAIWAADAAWWWIAPASYHQRPAITEHARRWLFVFMFVNGAIVFAGGVARLVGMVAVSAVCVAWALRPAASRGTAATA